MPHVLDLALLALFCIPLFLGWQRGFFRSFLSLGRLALAVLITALLGATAADWLYRTFVYPSIHESVYRRFSTLADEVSATARGGAEALAEKIPAPLRSHLDLHALDPSQDVHELAAEWSETVGASLSHAVSDVLGHLLVFVPVFLLLSLAILVVGGLIRRIPLVRTVDRILGLGLGLLIGGVGIFLISTLLTAILTLTGRGDLAEASLLLGFFQELRNGMPT